MNQTVLKTLRRFRNDLWITLAIVIVAAVVGTWFVTSGTVKKFHFYQEYFSPAVMAACGKGFVQPVPAPDTITAFLERRTESFACASISPDQKLGPPEMFQVVHQNLLLTVAGWWRMLGVSWDNLATLYGLVYGLSAGLAYLILRTVARPWLAIILTCLFFISPPQLFNLPHLRDYIKAPFMLAVIAAMAWLLKAHLSRMTTLWVIAATGVITGLGVGFRIDLIILVPFFIALILFMLPGSLRRDLGIRLAYAVVFVACFGVAAYPILATMQGGGNMSHVIVLGLMGEFDQRLGLDPTFYSLGYHYLDMYAHTLVNSFAYANGYAGPAMTYPTALYNNAGTAYLLDVYKTFPADALARYLSSIWQILHLPIVAPVTFEDLYFFYDDYRPQWLMALTHHPAWQFVMLAVTAFSVAIIARKSLKLLISVVLVIVFLCGFPFLQFGVRHYFFLEVIGLWMFALCIQSLISIVLSSKRARSLADNDFPPTQERHWRHDALAIIAGLAFTFAVPLVLLGGLRHYQDRHLDAVFSAYANAATAPMNVQHGKSAAGWDTLHLDRQKNPANQIQSDKITTLYLVATFDSRRCRKDSVHVRMNYDGTNPVYDFSEAKSIGIDGHTRMVFPAYFRPGLIHFNGIDMPPEDFDCLTSIDQMTSAPPLHIPLSMLLTQDWKKLPRYRTFH